MYRLEKRGLKQEGQKDKEPKNLPDTLRRTHAGKEVNEDTIPEELADEGKDGKTDDKGNESRRKIDIGILL